MPQSVAKRKAEVVMKNQWNQLVQAINEDKHLFALPEYPLITAYDDFLFLQNDYDTLSRGQRNYLVRFLGGFGFRQTRGTLVTDGELKMHFLKPKILAQSSYESRFLTLNGSDFFMVTPTTFAETLFYHALEGQEQEQMEKLATLIDKAPFNMKLLRDISRTKPIESITRRYCDSIVEYQAKVIKEKFNKKRGLA